LKTRIDLINDFEQLILWSQSLRTYSKKNFFKPVSHNKWSVAEIIAHLIFWDRYILREMLPQIKPNAEITNIEFQT
jgi:hypothetical protein